MPSILLSELLNLPAGKRADLAMALWESLSDAERANALPVDSDLITELDRRWAEHVANPGSAVPWSDVERRLRG